MKNLFNRKLNRLLRMFVVASVIFSFMVVILPARTALGAVNTWTVGTGNWSNHGNWSLGHDPDATEDATFTGDLTGVTITIDADSQDCLNLDFSGASGNPTLAIGTNLLNCYGEIKVISTMNITGALPGGLYFNGNSATCKITTNGLTLNTTLGLRAAFTGTVTLQDNYTSTKEIKPNGGTINTNNKIVNCTSFSDNGGVATKIITLGSSIINCTEWSFNSVGLTLTANTSTINLSGNFTSSETTFHTVNFMGAIPTIIGSSTFYELNLPSGTTQTITFTDGTTQTITNTPNLSGSVGHIHTLQGSGVGGWTISESNKNISNTVDILNLWQSHESVIVGNYAYVVNNDSTTDSSKENFAILDITNPAAPVVLSTIDDDTNLRNCRQIEVVGNYAYVTMYHTLALGIPAFAVINISNPLAPAVVGTITDDVNLIQTHGIAIKGNYAYLTNYNSNPLIPHFIVVDISNPLLPHIAATLSDNAALYNPHSVAINGNYAYAVSPTAGVALKAEFGIVDISNPLSPVVVGSLDDDTIESPRSVIIAGDYAYIACDNNGGGSLQFAIIDITNPAAPVLESGITDLNNLPHAKDLGMIGNYVYVVVSSAGIESRFTTIDVRNPVAPIVVGTLTGAVLDDVISIIIDNGYAYITSDIQSTFSIVQLPQINADYITISRSTGTGGTIWNGVGASIDGGNNAGWNFPQTTTTQAATGVTMDKDGVTGGTLNGTIVDMGGATGNKWFEYGLTVAYGTDTAHTTYTLPGTFTAAIPTDLTPGETYHYRSVIDNGVATVNGADQTFTFTMPITDTITSTALTNRNGHTSGTFNGTITNMGVASDTYVYFNYGNNPAMGHTTTAQTVAAIGAVTGVVPDELNPGDTIYYQIVSLNGTTTSVGAVNTFVVPKPASYAILFEIFPVLIAILIVAAVISRLENPSVAVMIGVVAGGILVWLIANNLLSIL